MAHAHAHSKAIFIAYACLLLLTACVYALMYAPQPMFNSICVELHVERGTIGLLVTVFMLSLSISPLCVGIMLRKIGTRRAILIAAALLGASGFGIYLASSFGALLAMRTVQAFAAPILLTSALTCIAGMFRHLDMNRALAGYVTASLVGAFIGRLGGGYCAEIYGWRLTLTALCVSFFVCLCFAGDIPADSGGKTDSSGLAGYFLVLRQKGVPVLLLIEACGIFSFAAIGNLIPLRMAELGHGSSEGLIGLMYLGYCVGLVASLTLNLLKKIFGSTGRLLTFGLALYACSLFSLLPASIWFVFGGIWFIALGEYIVHSLAPGLINHLATKNGQCSRSMINGLFLSSYYFGGVLGSWLPGLVYDCFGWLSCVSCMLAVQVSSLGIVFWLRRHVVIDE